MSYSWLEIGIMLFITFSIGVTVWKGGQANPEGTGKLGRQIGELGLKVGNFDGKLAAIKLEVDDTDGRLKLIEQNAAKIADIKRLERAVQGLQEEVSEIGRSAAAREATLDHVKQQVDALYRVIVERGMGK